MKRERGSLPACTAVQAGLLFSAGGTKVQGSPWAALRGSRRPYRQHNLKFNTSLYPEGAQHPLTLCDGQPHNRKVITFYALYEGCTETLDAV